MKKFKAIRLVAMEAILVAEDKPLNRDKLMAMTGIGPAQVTRTIREYRDAFPENLKYGLSKYYEKTDEFVAHLISSEHLKQLEKEGESARLYQALQRVAQHDMLDAFIDAQLILNRGVKRSDFGAIFGTPTATTTRAMRRARERTGRALEYDADSGVYKLSGVFRKKDRLLADEEAAQMFMEDIKLLDAANTYAEEQLATVLENA